MKKYSVDHVCLCVKNLEATIALFREAFGMEVFRALGTAPARKVWLDGGIQLIEAAEFSPTGGMDHFALNVPESERQAVFEAAAPFGCTQAEGLTPYQWIYLPEGQLLELTDITQQHNA